MDYSSILHPTAIKNLVSSWIADDIPSTFDVGGMVVGSRPGVAHLYMKQSGVVGGRPFFDAVFGSLEGCSVEWVKEEESQIPSTSSCTPLAVVEGGSYTYTGTPLLLAIVRGPLNQILRGERTALCALSRCSGVATDSRVMVEKGKSLGWSGTVAGTRKTTPGFRVVEKYGLLVGGADTHRLDLSHMVMLKDNHIWACGGDITAAVKSARKGCGFSSKIEVECRTLEEAFEACEAGADVVMLDNMEGKEARDNAGKVKGRYGHVIVEVSGGITVDSMQEYVGEFVDVLSCGRLTQGYGCLDFSLKVQQD